MNKYLVILFLLITRTQVSAQCPSDLLSGQNLVVNGDFSQGYTGWTYASDPTGENGYIRFGSTGQTYSGPGYIYAGSSADHFNHDGFDDYPDHSESSDNMMLMVDGICKSGVTLWSQTLNVSPNTNYYFSVWISSLKDNPNFPGTLDFTVNGISLGTPVTAPLKGHVWDFFEATWNSGSASGPITITIANTTTQGCDKEVDFAIDDIAFIPGCAYGAVGPQPDLGADRTLCGLGGSGIILDAGVPHNTTTIITWTDSDGITSSGSGINAPYTLSATKPGTYSVCVSDNGSCTKSDVIVINNSFTVNLGPDIELCNPAAVTLDAGFTGIGVTYKWYKNYPTEADGDNRQKTYYVNTPGIYKVDVTDPLCGMQTAQITISTKAPVATNALYCNPGNVTLSVSPNNNGKYKWWTSQTGTASSDLATKGVSTYTFAAVPTNNYTFYVEDTASFRISVGLPLTGNGLTNPQNRSVQSENELKFDVLTAIVIDSVYIDLHTFGCPSQSIQLEVVDASGNIVGTSSSWSATSADGCIIANSVVFKMPVGIAVPVGTGYTLRMSSGSNMNWYQSGMTYQQNYAGVISFTGNSTSSWAANAIPGMYRWVVTAGAACARVPVTATFKSCLPPPPVPDAHAGSDLALCNTRTTQLQASLNSGETGVWTFVPGSIGTVSPVNSPTATVNFVGDTARLVWNVTNVTGTTSDTVVVSTTIVPKPVISGPGLKCPGTPAVTFTANPDHTANGSTYTWSVFQGDVVLVSGENSYQLTADAGQLDGIVQLTETFNHCSSKNTDTIRMAPSNAVAQAGPDLHTCNTSVILAGNEPLSDMGKGTWTLETVSSGVTMTAQTPYSIIASNLKLNTVYQFKYTIDGACGPPSSAYVTVTVGGSGFAIGTVDQPADTLCIGSQRDFTVKISPAGSGFYNYVWNKKGTTDLIQTATPTYSIVTSSLVEVYYVHVEDTKTNCSTSLDSVEVISINHQHLNVPNLITPNGDHLNDAFKVTELHNINNPMVAKNSEFIVYNSWGNEVFRANNYNNDWKAHNSSDGMYFYYLKAGCGGEEHKGWLQILGNVYE